MSSNKSFADVLRELSEPFPTNAVQFRPGATNKEKTSAQALAFVDMREYQDRLNKVCPDWESKVEVHGNVVKVSLTIAGVTREEVGEASPNDENTITSAMAQAFKRACAAFGLGRYLYRLPKVWCAYDANRRKLLEIPVLPDWAVPAGEREAYTVLYAGQRKIPVNGYQRQTAPSQQKPQSQPRSAPRDASLKGNSNGNLGNIVVKYGKFEGKKLGDLSNEELGELARGNSWIAKRAAEYLASKPAEPTAEALTRLPVATAPAPKKVNGNGGNGHKVPEDPFGDFDDIPF